MRRGLFEVVLLHVVAERPETHSEQLRRLDLHATRLAERIRDVLALEMLDVFLEVEALFRQHARGSPGGRLRRRAWRDDRTLHAADGLREAFRQDGWRAL